MYGGILNVIRIYLHYITLSSRMFVCSFVCSFFKLVMIFWKARVWCLFSRCRRCRQTRSAADKEAWIRQLKTMHELYNEKSRQYWCDKISDSKGNSKKLWTTLSGVMGEKVERCNTKVRSADNFANFFDDKVKDVRASTSATPLHDVPLTASYGS